MEAKAYSFIRKYAIIAEILFCAFIFWLAYLKAGLWFETEDDAVIHNLLSGFITGKPEWHTLYNSPLLTVPMTWFYSIAPGVPWWGALLLLCHGLSILIPLDAIIKKSKNLFNTLTYSIGFVFCVISFWYVRSRIQHTSTAMLLAIAGYVALVLYEEKKNLWVFGILEFLSYVIRPEAMEIIQPIGLGLVIASLVVNDEKLVKNIKKVLLPIGILLGIILVGMISNKIAYSRIEWDTTTPLINKAFLKRDIFILPIISVWALLFCVLFIKRRVINILKVAGTYLVPFLIVYGYLTYFYKEEIVAGIRVSLYFFELLFAFVITLLVVNREDYDDRMVRLYPATGIIALVVTGIFVGGVQLRNTVPMNDNFGVLTEADIGEYCSSHIDSKFIIAEDLLPRLKSGVLSRTITKPNYIFSGGWFSCLPTAKAYEEEYLSEGEVYYICMDDYYYDSWNIPRPESFKNLENRFGTIPEKVDEYRASAGMVMAVYKMR